MSKENDESIDGFDETNGLAPGLEGDADDPGHVPNPDEPNHNLIGEIGEELTNGFTGEDAERDPDYERDPDA